MSAFFDTRYYRVMKLCCAIVGLWPYQSRRTKIICQSFTVLALLSYIPPQYRRLYDVWGNLDAMCTCMLPIILIAEYLCKVMVHIQFQSEIKLLLRQIEIDWEMMSSKGEREILASRTLRVRGLCFGYAAMLSGGVVFYAMVSMIAPILDVISPQNVTRVRSLPFDVDYGVDLQTYFFWIWLHMFTVGGLVVLNIIALDILCFTLVNHACCLFAIARHKLEYVIDAIKERAQFSEARDAKYNASRHERLKMQEQMYVIRECVLSHKKAIKYTQLLQYIYMWSLFVIIGIAILNMSMSITQMASRMDQRQLTDIIISIIYLGVAAFQVFLQNVTSQMILDQSLKIHESAYSFDWYDMPVKIQKNIILILMRSRTPCKIVAGKLFVLSLEGFSMIMQTSLSYFTVLASFQ